MAWRLRISDGKRAASNHQWYWTDNNNREPNFPLAILADRGIYANTNNVSHLEVGIVVRLNAFNMSLPLSTHVAPRCLLLQLVAPEGNTRRGAYFDLSDLKRCETMKISHTSEDTASRQGQRPVSVVVASAAIFPSVVTVSSSTLSVKEGIVLGRRCGDASFLKVASTPLVCLIRPPIWRNSEGAPSVLCAPLL